MNPLINDPRFRAAVQTIKDLINEAFPPVEMPAYDAIDPKHQEDMAECLTDIVACVVASQINAGSEADAVNENLFPHILAELKGYGPEGTTDA